MLIFRNLTQFPSIQIIFKIKFCNCFFAILTSCKNKLQQMRSVLELVYVKKNHWSYGIEIILIQKMQATMQYSTVYMGQSLENKRTNLRVQYAKSRAQ